MSKIDAEFWLEACLLNNFALILTLCKSSKTVFSWFFPPNLIAVSKEKEKIFCKKNSNFFPFFLLLIVFNFFFNQLGHFFLILLVLY